MILNDKYLNRYRYALCKEHVVNIDDVTKETRKSLKFTCLGCGHEMVAVLGEERVHHFRHKNNENCSNETYLHNLAKKRIKEIFDTNEHFHIIYKATNSCEHFGSCPFNRCKKEFEWPLDLKEYFDTCEIEKGCGGFRPDILLSHSEHPNRKLFIEINVNHPCTDDKLNSGYRIIEIDVVSEQTIIYPFSEDFEHIHFFNFDFKRDITPQTKVERFSLLSEEDNRKIPNQDEINCFQFNEHLPNAIFDIIVRAKHKQISLEFLGLAQTMLHNIPVKNCCFCINRPLCTVTWNSTIKDEKDGKEKIVQHKKPASNLTFNDQWIAASRCRNYKRNIRGCHNLINDYGKNNFILWKKKNQ